VFWNWAYSFVILKIYHIVMMCRLIFLVMCSGTVLQSQVIGYVVCMWYYCILLVDRFGSGN